jgi:hypothetical protein
LRFKAANMGSNDADIEVEEVGWEALVEAK